MRHHRSSADLLPIRDGSRWEDFLVSNMLDLGLRFDQEAWRDAGTHNVAVADAPEAVTPAERFLSSVLSGRVESSKRWCEHVGVTSDSLVMTRSHAHWIVACVQCAVDHLKVTGQDTRCDWCGESRPDRTPTSTFRFRQLHLVAQFCPPCAEVLGLTRAG